MDIFDEALLRARVDGLRLDAELQLAVYRARVDQMARLAATEIDDYARQVEAFARVMQARMQAGLPPPPQIEPFDFKTLTPPILNIEPPDLLPPAFTA